MLPFVELVTSDVIALHTIAIEQFYMDLTSYVKIYVFSITFSI